MLRRKLQQLSCFVNTVTFSVLLCLLLAHTLVRRYLPNVAHGKENFDFFFEGDQEGDDQHHPPFVVDWRVVFGTVLSFLISCAVDVGGLAGGGLLVPVFYQVVGFGLKASTGLSQAAIAGASAAALAANLFRAQVTLPGSSNSSGNKHAGDRASGGEGQGPHGPAAVSSQCRTGTSSEAALLLQHPQAAVLDAPAYAMEQHHHHQQLQQQQPLVDLDLILLLTPGLLLGVAVGTLMNDLLPEWFITAALVGVLWLSCHKTAVRGLLTWHAEAQAEASLAAAAAIQGAPQPRLRRIHTGGGTLGSPSSGSPCSSATAADFEAQPRDQSTPSSSSTNLAASAAAAAAAAVPAHVGIEAGSVSSKQLAGLHTEPGLGELHLQHLQGLQEDQHAANGNQQHSQHYQQQQQQQGRLRGTPHKVPSVVAQPAAAGSVAAAAAAWGQVSPADSSAAAAAAVSPTTPPAAAAPAGAVAVGGAGAAMPGAVGGSAVSDSDSSPRSSYGQLQHRHSTPIYSIETTPLPHTQLYGGLFPREATAAAAQQHGAWLHPSWGSSGGSPEDAVPAGAPGLAAVGGAWGRYSSTSSFTTETGLGYVISDSRLPVLRQQWQWSDSSRSAAAAAAASAALQLQQLWLWLPSVQLERVPWMKLVSLWTVWLGFMGLTALGGLLPLCSWGYIIYLVLFIGITGCVTGTLICVMLVEPLVGVTQVSSISRKWQQLMQQHKHSWRAARAQQDMLKQPLLQQDQVQPTPCQQQQQHAVMLQVSVQQPQPGSTDSWPCATTAAAAAPVVAPPGMLRDATRSVPAWLHILSGFGKAPAASPDEQQQQQYPQQYYPQQQQQQYGSGYRVGLSDAGGAAAAISSTEIGAEQGKMNGEASQQHLPEEQQGAAAQPKLSLFTQMRLRQQQQQQGVWAQLEPPMFPPMPPAAAATDSYFFPNVATSAGAGRGSGSSHSAATRPGPSSIRGQPPRRVRRSAADVATAAASAAATAPAGDGLSSRVAGLWVGFTRVLQGVLGPQQPQPLDPFDGNEQPSREEEPFPVAAVSPGPAPSLAAAAAAAAHAAAMRSSSGSSSSSGLVAIAAAAAVVSVAAGVLTAVTGVAGSPLIMPILLDFRIHTQVAMASTIVLVFLSSTAAALCFILQGRLIFTYALLFCLVGLCGGCLGVSVVGALLRLARRPSVVVLLLAAALAVAGLSCAVAGVEGFVDAWKEGERLGFRAVCQL